MSSTKTRETNGGWWFYSGYRCTTGRYCYYSRDFGVFQYIELPEPVYSDKQKRFMYCSYWGDAAGRFISSSEPSDDSD